MVRARQLLESLRAADARDEALIPLADNLEGHEAASDTCPAEIEACILEADGRGKGSGAELDRGAVASAAANRNGQIIIVDKKFASWLSEADLTGRIMRGAGSNRPRLMVMASSISGWPVAVASARGASSCNWPLHEDVAYALASDRAANALLAFMLRLYAWETVAETFALTPSEARSRAGAGRARRPPGGLAVLSNRRRSAHSEAAADIAERNRRASDSWEGRVDDNSETAASAHKQPFPIPMTSDRFCVGSSRDCA